MVRIVGVPLRPAIRNDGRTRCCGKQIAGSPDQLAQLRLAQLVLRYRAPPPDVSILYLLHLNRLRAERRSAVGRVMTPAEHRELDAEARKTWNELHHGEGDAYQLMHDSKVEQRGSGGRNDAERAAPTKQYINHFGIAVVASAIPPKKFGKANLASA